MSLYRNRVKVSTNLILSDDALNRYIHFQIYFVKFYQYILRNNIGYGNMKMYRRMYDVIYDI